ncbi:MAG: lysophospholipase [Cellulosilyticaceae bacterium]
MRKVEWIVESNTDEYRLECVGWLPDRQVTLKGIVQLIHGSCEHMMRYEGFARFLTSRGYGVYAHNHRGHGAYAREMSQLGYFGAQEGWQKLVEDCYQINQGIKEIHKDKKIVMLGHSMGSFIARHYAILYSETIDGLILTGTAHHAKGILDMGISIAERAIAKGKGNQVHSLLDKMSYGAFPLRFYKEKDQFAWLTRDVKIREQFKKDSLCGFKFTATAFRDMFEGIKFITDKDNIEKMRKNLPILLLSGEEDPVGGFGKMVIKSKQLMQEAGMQDIGCKLYPGMRHEILNEMKHEEVYQDILRWIQKII